MHKNYSFPVLPADNTLRYIFKSMMCCRFKHQNGDYTYLIKAFLVFYLDPQYISCKNVLECGGFLVSLQPFSQ